MLDFCPKWACWTPAFFGIARAKAWREQSTAFGHGQIFERRQRPVDREVAIIDQEIAAHAVFVQPKIDLVGGREVAIVQLEVTDRDRPGGEIAKALLFGGRFKLRIAAGGTFRPIKVVVS